MKKFALFLTLSCLSVFAVFAQPVITSFSPTIAEVGATVTITGTNFSATPSSNIVYFGGARATVLTASETVLTVTVPNGSTRDFISVTKGGLTAYSRMNFNLFNSGTAFIAGNYSLGAGVTVSSVATTTNYPLNGTDAAPGFDVIVGASDFDNDGWPDIFKAGNGAISVNRNLLTTTAATIAANQFSAPTNYTVTGDTRTIVTADINSDGKLDIITGSSTGISILRNTSTSGTISFATAVNISTATTNVRVADFDLDGKLDIAAVNNGNLNIFKNTSVGNTLTFNDAVATALSTTSFTGIDIGDLNNDGKIDIVASKRGGVTNVILNNSTVNALSLSNSFTIAEGSDFVIVDDIDKDGKNDIYFYNRFLKNNYSTGALASANFTAYTNTQVNEGGGVGISAPDINADGYPEIILGSWWSHFWIQRNAGTGTPASLFSSKFMPPGVGGNAMGVDLNGDQKIDVISSNHGNSPGNTNVAIFQNTMTPTSVITVNNSMSTFNKCNDIASSVQSFTVSGTGLQANIVITPPSGFEISTSIGSGFGSSAITLTQTSGTVNSTLIYVRVLSTNNASSTGTLSLTSTGASTVNIGLASTLNPSTTITSATLTAQTICQNGTATALSVTASGSSLTYQWYSNTTSSNTGGTLISGATSSSYTPSTAALGTMYYYCIVSGTCSPAATSNVSGAINVVASIAGSVAVTGGNAVCTGSTKSLTVSGHAGSISWQSSSNGSTWNTISGETSTSYTTASLTANTYYRAQITNGSCAAVNTSSQLISVDPLSVAGTISGSAAVCPNATSTLTLSGYTGTIVWTSASSLSGTYTSVGNSNAVYTTGAINGPTYFKAQVTSGTCPAVLTNAYTVTTTPLGSISSISGPSTVTLGGTATYSISSVTNATSYVWNLPAGMSISSNSNSGATIVVSVANNFAGGTVTAQALGCTNSSVVSKVISAPGVSGIVISTSYPGAPIICGGSTGVGFSVPSIAGATYSWTLPSGVSLSSGYTGTESSILVDFASDYAGGSLSATRTSSLGTNTAYYGVGALSAPSAVSGSSQLCGLSSSTYSISSVSGATSYEWQLPSGMSGSSTSTSINATWSGSVSGSVQVRAVGACGKSTWRSLGVASVATPGNISGPTVICGAATYTITGGTMTQVSQTTLNYSVTNVAGLTYTWTVPAGMSISSGQGTNAIVVSVTPSSFTSGQVTVTAADQANNTCTSSTRTLDVYKAVNAITGPSVISSAITTVTYSVPNVTGYTYNWTVPTGMTISSGATSHTVTASVTHPLCSTGVVSCAIETTCGNTTVTRNVSSSSHTALLSSFNNATQGYFSNVTVTPVSGATGYKFKLESSTGTTVYAESSNHVLPLYSVPNFTYGVSYDISVAIKTAGTSYDDNGYGCAVTINTSSPSIDPASCGTTVGSFSNILATPMGPNTGYKFKLVEGSNTIEVTSTNHVLPTYTIPGFKYGVTYSVSVALKIGNGLYGPYGTACNVNTTAPSIDPTSCGSTVGYYANILATPMGPNTGYKFKLVEGSNTIEVTSTNHVLPTYTIPNFKYGVTYTVSVALKNSNNEYGGYGPTCTFNTTAPTINPASCGSTVGYYANILATPMGPNTGYKFKLVEGSNTIEVTSTNHVLPTYTIPNFKYGVTYTVSVALKNSNNEYGGYGPTCTFNTTAPTINPASCGSTVGYYANILATPMGPNTGYKFKLVEGSNTIEVTSTNHVLPTYTIPNFKYGVTYTVSVALKNSNNEYGGYGPTCTFNTTAPTISNASCGNTVGYYANILATPMGPNTGYKFKLVNGSTTIEVTSTNHVLPVYSIPGIQPSTIYSVSVALKNANNEYGGYGPACNVTTSAYNSVITSLSTLSCTTSTYPSNGLSVITANEVNGAVAYRFKFEVAGGTSSFYLYSTTSSLDMFTAGLPTGDYNVSVAVATSASGATLSNYTYGTDGVACLIKYTAPASPMTLSDDTAMNSLTDGEEETQSNVSVNEEESTLSEELWSVRASTNPYEENFFLRLDNANGLSSDAVFTVRILDLQGKLIEQRSVVASGLEDERYGDGLSSGMYLVTLTDGTRQQTLRVVKK